MKTKTKNNLLAVGAIVLVALLIYAAISITNVPTFLATFTGLAFAHLIAEIVKKYIKW